MDLAYAKCLYYAVCAAKQLIKYSVYDTANMRKMQQQSTAVRLLQLNRKSHVKRNVATACTVTSTDLWLYWVRMH